MTKALLNAAQAHVGKEFKFKKELKFKRLGQSSPVAAGGDGRAQARARPAPQRHPYTVAW
jgi:hypothetical protein